MELLRQLRAEGHLILVSTHNLGSVPDFCDQVVMINRTVIAAGKTEDTFNQHNLEKVFGGVLQHIKLLGEDLHNDEDKRAVTVLTDDERPVVFYGETKMIRLQRLLNPVVCLRLTRNKSCLNIYWNLSPMNICKKPCG